MIENNHEISDVCCRAKMKKISWTDRLKNEILFHTVKKQILYTIKRKEANWIGHVLRYCTKDRKEDKKEEVSSYWMMTLSKREGLMEFEIGISRSHCQENSLWVRLCTSHKTDYTMNDFLFLPASNGVTF